MANNFFCNGFLFGLYLVNVAISIFQALKKCKLRYLVSTEIRIRIPLSLPHFLSRPAILQASSIPFLPGNGRPWYFVDALFDIHVCSSLQNDVGLDEIPSGVLSPIVCRKTINESSHHDHRRIIESRKMSSSNDDAGTLPMS